MTEQPQEPAALLARAREALLAHERTASLAPGVPHPCDASPPRVALVGPYSAGKSLLVAALLGMSHEDSDRISAATPHTTEIMSYVWRDCELLDLPGTLSGLDEHEQVARRGVRSADALVIVTTVELPGDDEADAIRQLLDRDGFRGRCVLCVNKSASENSDRVVRFELEQRVSDMHGVSVVFTDARDFLDSINEPELTDDDRALLRSDSGIADLHMAIADLLLGEVPPRRTAQLHEATRLLDDGLALWRPTAEEEAIDTTAARTQAALVGARKDADEAVGLALGALGDGICEIGSRLAIAVDPETGAVAKSDVEAASADEQAVLDDFVNAANRGLADAVNRLARDIELALEQQDEYARKLDGRRVKVPTATLEPGKRDRLVDAVQQRLSDAASKRLNRLMQGGTRPGSPLHDVARRLNRARGVTAVSYTHIHTAEKLEKGLGAAGLAIDVLGPVIDVGGVISDVMLSQRISQRRDDIRDAYAKHAAMLVSEERVRVRAHIDAQIASYAEAVSPQIEDAAAWRATRDEANSQLRAAREVLTQAVTAPA